MTIRQFKVQHAILEVLALLPGDYLLPQSILFSDASRFVPQLLKTEFDAALTALQDTNRIIGIQGEVSPKFQIAEPGRAWLAANP